MNSTDPNEIAGLNRLHDRITDELKGVLEDQSGTYAIDLDEARRVAKHWRDRCIEGDKMHFIWDEDMGFLEKRRAIRELRKINALPWKNQ
jgi:hypothetical protein